MRSATLRLPPFCLTSANHGGRPSTVAVAVALPTKADSSPTALMGSSAGVPASGSAAKKRFVPGSGSAKFSQPSELNARTYRADGAAAAISARLSNSSAPIRFTASITTLLLAPRPARSRHPGRPGRGRPAGPPRRLSAHRRCSAPTSRWALDVQHRRPAIACRRLRAVTGPGPMTR
jgi:hypothetical protein